MRGNVEVEDLKLRIGQEDGEGFERDGLAVSSPSVLALSLIHISEPTRPY